MRSQYALELDKERNQINKYQVFKDHVRAKYDPKPKRITHAPWGYQKIKVHWTFACMLSMMDVTKHV